MNSTTVRHAQHSPRTRAASAAAGLVLGITAALVLVGCAPAEGANFNAAGAEPETSATATPSGAQSGAATPAATPTPTPAAVVTTIVMSGSQLMSESETELQIGTVDFTQGTEASVEFLTAALGVPPETVAAADVQACTDVTARYVWGDSALVLDVWEPAGFVVTFWQPTVHGVALQSSGDFAVGDGAQAFFDTLPAEQATDEYGDGTGPFVYDQVAEASPWGETNAYGGVALLQAGGTVGRIVAPDTTRAFYC